jgi:cyclopropane-fatty-acyl-phospholipid synthase
MSSHEPSWGAFEDRYRAYFEKRDPLSFTVADLDGTVQPMGNGTPAFTLVVKDRRAGEALRSLDQMRVALAYLAGWLDVEGDIMAALSVRGFFNDFHPLAWAGRTTQALVQRARERDRRSIVAHYEREPEFFLTFLDTRYRCYTQGSFSSDDEPLEDAIGRKMDIALDTIGVKPGDRVLDVGGGWGAFLEYAGKRGIEVTSLTLSEESERFLNGLIERERLPGQVVRQHFLEYDSPQPYDAIVNMGATEHLPDYKASLRKYASLLRPGGSIYLDALAMRSKLRLSTFMKRYIWPGTSTPLLLHQYLRQVTHSPFLLRSLTDERHNYYLTCKAWAERLDSAKDEIVSRWGEGLYRRFRLYLWGSAASFQSSQVQAYSWVMTLPEAAAAA